MREEQNGCKGFNDFGELLRHELNNPLTGILGNAELLLAELQRHPQGWPEQTRTRLETIASLAMRMREAVRRLSDDWHARAAVLPEQPYGNSTEVMR